MDPQTPRSAAEAALAVFEQQLLSYGYAWGCVAGGRRSMSVNVADGHLSIEWGVFPSHGDTVRGSVVMCFPTMVRANHDFLYLDFIEPNSYSPWRGSISLLSDSAGQETNRSIVQAFRRQRALYVEMLSKKYTWICRERFSEVILSIISFLQEQRNGGGVNV